MGALRDIWHSEKGLMFVIIVAVMTAFVLAGTATFDQWKEVVLPIFGIYAGTKTATTIGIAIAQRGTSAAPTGDGENGGDVPRGG